MLLLVGRIRLIDPAERELFFTLQVLVNAVGLLAAASSSLLTCETRQGN